LGVTTKTGWASSQKDIAMTTIVLDRQNSTRFESIHDRAEIRGEDGRVLGVYVPAQETVAVVPKKIASPYTDEELDRWAAEPGGRSLAEILADLRSRS